MLGARNMTKDILSDRYGEIDKYQFTGPNVQGDFYTSIKDDEDDEDENYYDYDYDSFGPTGPARQNLYVQRGLKAAEDTRLEQKLAEERLQREKEKQAAIEEAKRIAAEKERQRLQQLGEYKDRGGFDPSGPTQQSIRNEREDKSGRGQSGGFTNPGKGSYGPHS